MKVNLARFLSPFEFVHANRVCVCICLYMCMCLSVYVYVCEICSLELSLHKSFPFQCANKSFTYSESCFIYYFKMCKYTG